MECEKRRKSRIFVEFEVGRWERVPNEDKSVAILDVKEGPL
jgi:hypothetical protein